MGATKKHIYTEEQLQLAEIFKALSCPARIAIIENINKCEKANFSDLNEHIDLAPSTISYHLKELSKVGILGVFEENNRSYFFLFNEPLKVVEYCIESIIELVKKVVPKFEYLCVVEYRYHIRKVELDNS
jgi:DNA-binding transcriptional ArsR family regulator